ncbi:MAG TPA: cell division protein FtsZ [Bacteroidales bacterium]|nr:cell division protein FtsZ [Bacteroidales bacterium]HPB25015.1 cell division protein FtsZ [Bacteroidales bacterium]HPI30152.1 cell division protein FtsZ [Bacteroidales bacterium]HQN15179.1 cell division protein FtsZ [Bacteroidales bacterium]HQP15419.1 cell division protein FtsZ [Bacteroidales bacterium]
MTIKFDSRKDSSSKIKVIGVGGGGSNAVNHMYKQGIIGVDFVVSNTDCQALDASPVPNKIQLGSSLTEGLGAGAIPDTGRKAALETIDEIKEFLQPNTKMVFITAGMGGGTGTGAAPVIAQAAREMGILTVGIVTLPFSFEGKKRKKQAQEGLDELRKYVDTLLVICNDKLRELHRDLKLSEAFSRADDVLTIAAKGIAEIITVSGYINVDFNDVNTVMRNSGVAIMGTGLAEGENRAVKAVENALSSPLLNENDITGAQNILLYIASGSEEITMDEVTEITDYIQDSAGSSAEIIWGNGTDESLGSKISVTLIATGFSGGEKSEILQVTEKQPEKIVVSLEKEPVKEVEKKPEVKDEMVLFTKEPEKEEIKISNPVITVSEPPVSEKPNTIVTDNSEKELKISFDVKQSDTEFFVYTKKETAEASFVNEPASNGNTKTEETQKENFNTEEVERLNKNHPDRVANLRAMSLKIKNKDGLEEIENTPAYIRRKVLLENNKPSSDSEISDLSIGSEDGDKPGIKKNPYIHDNPD